MTSRSRFRFFMLLVAVFFIAAPLIILWSKGYRFDIESRAVVRAGAIFIKVDPESAEVRIEGIAQRKLKSRFPSSGYLVGNLIPDTYRVHVTKEGYYPWAKDLAVKPLQVAKASAVVLFPEIPNIKPLSATSVTGVWLTEGGTKELYFTNASMSKLFIWSPDRKDPPRELFRGISIPQKEQIINVMPSGASDLLLIALTKDRLIFDARANKIQSLSVYLRTIGASQINLTKIFWHPIEGRQLLGLTPDGRLYILDLAAQVYKRINTEQIIGYSKDAKSFLDSTGSMLGPRGNNSLEKFDEIKLPRQAEKGKVQIYEITILPQRQYILHNVSIGEVWLSEEAQEPILIAPNAKKIVPSPDQTKIAIFSRDQILSVYFLKDSQGDIFIPSGSVIRLGLVDVAVEDIFWLKDRWHLAMRAPDEIEIIEIDSRYPINRVSYPLASNSAVFRLSENSLLYVSQNTLWEWKFAE